MRFRYFSKVYYKHWWDNVKQCENRQRNWPKRVRLQVINFEIVLIKWFQLKIAIVWKQEQICLCSCDHFSSSDFFCLLQICGLKIFSRNSYSLRTAPNRNRWKRCHLDDLHSVAAELCHSRVLWFQLVPIKVMIIIEY